MTKYQKYQLKWMIDHNYSLDDLVDALTELQYFIQAGWKWCDCECH